MSKSTAQNSVISADLDLPEAWNQTLEEIARVVGWDLGPLTSLSAEEQTGKIAEITNSISPQKAGKGSISRARRVFGDVLSGIQVFGGFVAQGAAIVRPSTFSKSNPKLTNGRYSGRRNKSSML